MTGSMIIIDLPGPVAAEQVAGLGAMLEGVAARCREARTGSYDVEIEPARLGVEPGGGGPRFFTVNIAGPGFGDEGVFRAEHAADPDLEPLIGFTPTHDLVVAGDGYGSGGQRMLTELAARVQELVGGVIDLRISARLLERLRGLPGMVAVGGGTATEDLEGVRRLFGTAEFLRAWALHPEFDDYQLGAWWHTVHY